nr:hypothetical protein BaRGS_004677 [Batillaria attramentaria]
MRESGNITFNPTSNGHDYYDCIWVIQKEPHYEKIMVKVVNFSTRGSSGPTSGSNSRNTLSVGIIIPIVIFTFLIVVIGLLIIFILRCRRLSRQARRSQRHRHVNTVSDSVSGRRRHNRRRGPRGGTGGGSHDLPPSYEEVLSTTPIGYLNLGSGGGRGEGGVNSQGDGLERPNTRHSIAKPDEGNSTESAVSTTNNLTNKDGQQKPENVLEETLTVTHRWTLRSLVHTKVENHLQDVLDQAMIPDMLTDASIGKKCPV